MIKKNLGFFDRLKVFQLILFKFLSKHPQFIFNPTFLNFLRKIFHFFGIFFQKFRHFFHAPFFSIFFTFLIPTFLFWFHGHFFENFTGGILIWRARFWNFSRVRCIFSLALFSENHPREDAKFQKSENSPPEENPKSRRGIKPPLRNSVLHMKLKILQSLPRGQLTAWWRHKTFLESYFWRWLDFCFS